MPDSLKHWGDKILAGDARAIARAISAVEGGEEPGRSLLKLIFKKAGRAYVAGITGAPGTGKSTLVEKLALEYRAAGNRVGIVAVDPTSPFSGGAILGDRVRMPTLATDDGVYIRSMATRGHLGGLTACAHEVVTILDAAGCQIVLVETVGVGQDEVDVARLADVTVVMLVPGMGDSIQVFKAGVMEIADIFVINKADHPGADRIEQEIAAMLSLGARSDTWRPPILQTVATTGACVPAVRQKLEEFRSFAEQPAIKQARRRQQCRARVLELMRQRLFEKALAQSLREGALESAVERILAHRADPYSVVDELIGQGRQRTRR